MLVNLRTTKKQKQKTNRKPNIANHKSYTARNSYNNEKSNLFYFFFFTSSFFLELILPRKQNKIKQNKINHKLINQLIMNLNNVEFTLIG